MASKKGLSEAEKRTRMSEIFLSVSTPHNPTSTPIMWTGGVLYLQGDRKDRNATEKDCLAKRERHLAVSRG